MERFQPDVTMSDYEYFVPRAARRAGLPCLSVDHQHVITACRHPVPWTQNLCLSLHRLGRCKNFSAGPATTW